MRKLNLSEKEWNHHRLAGGSSSVQSAFWRADEIEILSELIKHGITNARYIASQDWLPKRTAGGISKKIREITVQWEKNETGKKNA